MGLAASQTRLLALTSRQHSIEGKAQLILGDKKRLANESDAVYEKYMQALDTTVIKSVQYDTATGKNSWIDGSVQNLLRYKAATHTMGNVFYVQDLSSGNIYLPESIGSVYEDNKNNKLNFIYSISDKNKEFDEETKATDTVTNERIVANGDTVKKYYYFDYYSQMFDAIKNAGGWIAIPAGSDKNPTWVSNMIRNGEVILTAWDSENEILSKTSASLNTNLREMTDENAINIASQEYEADMAEINEKEAVYDKKLTMMETEKETIELELDAIKEVMNTNIEAQFKVFS